MDEFPPSSPRYNPSFPKPGRPPIPTPFETHLTLHPDAARDVPALRDRAASLRLKLTHILLSHGRSPSQPMLTRHATSDSLPAELSAARVLTPSPSQPVTRPLTPAFPLAWTFDDWPTFQRAHNVPGTVSDWQHRLTAALAPTFA